MCYGNPCARSLWFLKTLRLLKYLIFARLVCTHMNDTRPNRMIPERIDFELLPIFGKDN